MQGAQISVKDGRKLRGCINTIAGGVIIYIVVLTEFIQGSSVRRLFGKFMLPAFACDQAPAYARQG